MIYHAATKLFGMAQAAMSGQMPQALIKYVMAWMQISEKLLERILKDFDQADSEQLVADSPTREEIMAGIQEMLYS